MKITIHQPEHMPWLGFFHKINLSDVYVVLDNVQYCRHYFQNRNKIRTIDGWQWLTVPIEKDNIDTLLIKDTKISKGNLRWKNKNLESICQNYRKAPYFKNYWDALKSIYNRDYTNLIDLNLDLIKFFFDKLGIKTEIRLASELNVFGYKNELILHICQAVGANLYISGISGKEYLDIEKFSSNGIEVMIQEFHHPIYKQLHEPFIPCMSIVDLLFNYGDKSLDIINGIGASVMDEVFL